MCEQTSDKFKIDSIAIGQNRAYFFSNNTVAAIKLSNEKLLWIKNIDTFILFRGLNAPFQPPVNIAFTPRRLLRKLY